MKALKTLFIVIGIITVLGVGGFFIFMNVASSETKRNLFQDTVMEEVGIDRKIYVNCEITSARMNLLGTKWVISGVLSTNNEKQNYTSQTIVFHFSDGDEYENFNYRLNGTQLLKRPFEARFSGHKNASFLSAEVVSAE